MNQSWVSAVGVARDAVGAQHYPTGALYVVATPIGNLGDISLRALHLLSLCDTLACEDTRHSQSLLRAYGIERNSDSWLAVHEHNEAQAAQTVIERLRAGQRVTYLSDAGTPAVSDPGARLARAVGEAGLRVVPIPGASSVTALLSVAGAVGPRADFVFRGFLPTKTQERAHAVADLGREGRAVVLLEAPHRIEALAQALAALASRSLTVGRELTKQFEQVALVPCDGFSQWLGADPSRCKGEFALLLHPLAADAAVSTELLGADVLKLLLPELPLKTAVRLAAQISGGSKNALYEAALTWKEPAA